MESLEKRKGEVNYNIETSRSTHVVLVYMNHPMLKYYSPSTSRSKTSHSDLINPPSTYTTPSLSLGRHRRYVLLRPHDVLLVDGGRLARIDVLDL